MNRKDFKAKRRNKIRQRVRSVVSGTAERPRLSVFKSNKHVYLQLINDAESITITAASTLTPSLAEDIEGKTNVDAARLVGKVLAEAAKDRGINRVVFDRRGYNDHGISNAAAEAAREGRLGFYNRRKLCQK